MTATFFIYKLAGFLATPLGLFFFILVITPFWAGKNKKKLHRILFSSTVFLMIMSMNITANKMLEGLETIVPEIPTDSCVKTDVAVLVLSAGSASNCDGTLTPDPYAISRITAGIKIAGKNGWPIIFSGGLGTSRNQSLANTMKVYARNTGYSGPIILEEKSRNTWENMIYSLEVLKKYHFNKIVLVTSSFHMKRTLWKARKVMLGIKLYPYPVGAIGDRSQNTLLDWIPTAGGLSKSTLAWKEYLGLFIYKIIY